MEPLDDKWTLQFKELVAKRIGLHFRQKDLDGFGHTIRGRIRELRLESPGVYYQLLLGEEREAEREWEQLVLKLTIAESYFFRDSGQFNLIRQTLLPRLISENRDKQTLKIWSAGCSTGEEPYSLAMVIEQLLPFRQKWDIEIIGSDINQDVLKRARKAIYPSWSFRLTAKKVRDDFFIPRGELFVLNENIRKMVRFEYLNLITDPIPSVSAGITDVDLILCRNVFIYFEPETVADIVGRMERALRPGGFLVTGHGELYTDRPRGLKICSFPESLIYQRPLVGEEVIIEEAGSEEKKSKPASIVSSVSSRTREPETSRANPAPTWPILSDAPAATNPAPKPSVAPPSPAFASPENSGKNPGELDEPAAREGEESEIQQSGQFFAAQDYQSCIRVCDNILTRNPEHYGAHYLRAASYANLGDNQKAKEAAERSLRVDMFAVQPYYLLAQLAEERGDGAESRRLLKRVLYLDSTHIAAYLNLAANYERDQDADRARKMRRTALDILKSYSTDAEIDNYEGMTAGRLVDEITRLLAV